MNSEKKIDKVLELIDKNMKLLCCPVCKEKFSELKNKTLYCENGHCFDVSKKGYINLLNSPVKMEYSKELFEARNYICSVGFYQKLQEKLSNLIEQYIYKFNDNNIRIMDVGCGEGSHLKVILDNLSTADTKKFTGIGIDISKNAISVAARDYSEILWCVADLAKQPFAEKSISIILNILSPANYKEFGRLLADEGMVLKVIPAEDYLKELRESFYCETDKAEYSNRKIVEHLKENMDIIHEENVKYTVQLSKEDLKKLISMTPLSWSADEMKVKKFVENNNKAITVDLLIIMGKIKECCPNFKKI